MRCAHVWNLFSRVRNFAPSSRTRARNLRIIANDFVLRYSGNSGMLVLPSQGRLGTSQPASHHSKKTSRLVNGRCAVVYYTSSLLLIGARKSHPQFHLIHSLLASSHMAALLYPQILWVAGGSSQTLAYHDQDRQRWACPTLPILVVVR